MARVVLGVLLLLALPTAAWAELAEVDPEAYGLEVEVGHDGVSPDRGWVPVEVRLAPRRPIAATLVVATRSPNGSTLQRELDVEVAAEARTVHRFVVPAGEVQVVVREGDDAATVEPRPDRPVDRFLVGRLGEAPAPAPALLDGPTDMQGTWVGVEPAWAEEPLALDGLAALVADASALTALGERGRGELAAAVARGLALVVVADGDGPVELPWLASAPVASAGPGAGGGRALEVEGEAWRVEQGGAVVAAARDLGRGRVVVTTADAGGRDGALWSRLTGPGDVGAPTEWDLHDNPYQFTRLMSGDGDGAPTVPWLAAFLAAYILVVAPVNGLVLHRLRRPELAWVTVPLVTVVFTGAAFAGAVNRGTLVGQVARAVWSVDGAAQEVVAVAVRSPQAAAHTASLAGTGWAVDALAEASGGSRAPVVRPTTDGVEATLQLSGFELGGLLARRATTELPPLALTAVAGPDGVEATVTNTGDEPLDGVAVRAATASTPVGALAPGEERVVTLGGARLPLAQAYRDALDGIADDRGATTTPGSLEAVLRTDLLDGDPGLVWAVGTAAGPAGGGAAGVRVAGSAPRDDGTLYAVGTRPALPDGGAVGPFAVDRELVSGAGDWRPGPQAVEGTSAAVLRYRLPLGGQLEQLHADLRRERGSDGTAELAVWDVPAAAWVGLDEAFADGTGDPARFLSDLGEVHVRATGELFPFEFSGRSVQGVATEETE